MRKDKKQVIGDEIGDEQIKLFLDFEPVDATSPSLHKLIKAYRGLRIDDFERFLVFFKEAGLDLDGKDEHGLTFVEVIKDQRNAAEYIELIERCFPQKAAGEWATKLHEIFPAREKVLETDAELYRKINTQNNISLELVEPVGASSLAKNVNDNAAQVD
jgi:hypothetical protein